MKSAPHSISQATLQQRALEARHLQLIEGNPFDAEDEAMFAAFEREGLSLEEQEEAILAKARKAAQGKSATSARNIPAAE